MLFGYNSRALCFIRAWHYKLARASINLLGLCAVQLMPAETCRSCSATKTRWWKKISGQASYLMKPKLYRLTIFFGSDVLRLATEDYMLFGWNSCARCLTRTLKLDRVLSASGQHCLVWAPSKMTILDGWGPNFAAYQSSLAGTFQGSPELLKIWIEFFVTRTNSWGFQPHQKLHFWIRPQFCSVTMFFASHVLRMKLNITLLLCNHLDSFPVAEFPCMFPSSAHLFPHLYDL